VPVAPDRRLTQSEPCLFEPGSLTVRRVDAYRWSLVDDLVYEGRWERFVIPAGFRTEGIRSWAVTSHEADGIFRRV